jgi:sugar lactone lactonase YvrE
MTDTSEREAKTLRVVAEGLAFPESPRWHDGELWFSDIDGGAVKRLPADGGPPVVVLEVSSKPSGLGWLPDGRLLVVAMGDRELLRVEVDGTVSVAADLRPFARFKCNDMLVDALGRAYVGQFGFDPSHEEPRATELLRVDPDGAISVAAEGLQFPNAAVLTPDGRTMIIAESWSHDLTAFDVAPDGTLSGRRQWAHLEGAAPDGICLDAEGAIWLASPISKEVIRVAEGGRVLTRIGTGMRRAIACNFGGGDLGTLYVTTAGRAHEVESGTTGRIEAIDVDVPGAGQA